MRLGSKRLLQRLHWRWLTLGTRLLCAARPARYDGIVPESRYSRQTRFAPLGEAGQQRIRQSVVVVVGCGALGTVEAELLARAGVSTLRIIDRDSVEWSNLHRQLL